jgi:hypothetical protein
MSNPPTLKAPAWQALNAEEAARPKLLKLSLPIGRKCVNWMWAMRPPLLFVATLFVLVGGDSGETVAQSGGRKLHAFLAVGKESKPATTFSSDVSTIYAFWKGEALQTGDKIEAVWIADDIGDAGPKESRILEGKAEVLKPEEEGSFSLSRPRSRIWPVGKYRVELRINGSLAEVVEFTIIPGVTIEVPKANPP